MPIKKDSTQGRVAQSILDGNIALSKNELDEAAAHFEQASKKLRLARISDGPELKSCLKGLADIYLRQDRTDEALKKAKALIKIDDTPESRRLYVVILSAIATARAAGNDRQAAEEAYGLALSEATALLPPNDPLTKELNTACLEIFKRTIKFKAITAIDQQVVLSSLPTDAPVEDDDDDEEEELRKRQKEEVEEMRKASVWSGSHMPSFLHSHLLLVTLSLLLIGAFVKAALLVPTKTITVTSQGNSTGAPGSAVAISGPSGNAAIATGTPGSQGPAIKPVVVAPGKSFESCDQLSSFSIVDKQYCLVKKGNAETKYLYRTIDDDWLNLKVLLQGHLLRRELWYQVNTNGLMDNNKTTLYDNDAPEFVIATKMRWYADMAQKWIAQKHIYPSDTEKCRRLYKDFGYLNPFTMQQDSAALVSLRNMPNDPASSVRPPDDRGAPHWRPGGISCISIDGTRFYIHGYDRAGIPLTSSDPSRYFVIECRDGINLTNKNLLMAEHERKSQVTDDKTVVLICNKPDQAGTIRYFRSLSCVTVWLAAFFAGLWCFSTFKLKQSNKIKLFSGILCLISIAVLCGWYLLAFSADHP